MVWKKKKKQEEPEIPEAEDVEESIDLPETAEVTELNKKVELLQQQIKEMKTEDEEEEPPEIEPPKEKKSIVEEEQKIVRVPVYLSESEMIREIYVGIQRLLLERGEDDKGKMSD